MKLLLSKERKLMRVDTDDFTVKLNGRTNEDYKQIFAAFGITLVFEEEDAESVAKELPPVKRQRAKPVVDKDPPIHHGPFPPRNRHGRRVIPDAEFQQHEHEMGEMG